MVTASPSLRLRRRLAGLLGSSWDLTMTALSYARLQTSSTPTSSNKILTCPLSGLCFSHMSFLLSTFCSFIYDTSDSRETNYIESYLAYFPGVLCGIVRQHTAISCIFLTSHTPMTVSKPLPDRYQIATRTVVVSKHFQTVSKPLPDCY